MDPISRILKETEDIWTPYKELYSKIQTLLTPQSNKPLSFLEDLLRIHKNTFINLLKNVPKDEKCRSELRQYANKNTTIPGKTTTITEQLFQETCIVSDLMECNEYIALDLLCLAEHQLPSYPGLTRGLVAVLLYYDGRSAICDTLCLLAQARNGISWQLDVQTAVGKVIGAFMDQLVSNNLIGNILDLLEKMEPTKELTKLQQSRGLGGPKHVHKVTALINKIRQSLADTIFCLAAQAGLPHEPLMRLIKYLSHVKLELDGSGVIDGVTLALEMALLYSLDVSVVHRREDGEEQLQKLPIMNEKNLVRELTQQFCNPKITWKCRGLQALAQFTWGLSLCSLHSDTASLRPHKFEIYDRYDDLINFALDDSVFDFVYRVLLPHQAFAKEEYYQRRIHTLLTDFIIMMPLKVKDLVNEADIFAKTMQSYTDAGLRPPNSMSRNFENFLLCLASLYMRDDLGLELSLDFWNPPESSQSNLVALTRTPQAQITLNKFMQSVGDMLPPSLFVPYLKLLTALAKGPKVAKHAFTLLNSSGTISWDHFFKSLHRYSSNLHQELAPAPTDSVYRARGAPRGINPVEIPGLHAVLALIRTVAEYDPVSRVILAESPNWNAVHTILGLVKCAVPVPLKADLLLALAAMSKNTQVATTVWHKLEMSGILATVPSVSTFQPKGIQTELEEVEARNEEFPLSRAFVTLLSSLTEATELPLLLGVGRRTPGLEPYLYFVVDCLLLRFKHRAYRRPEEKWEVAETCLGLLVQFLNLYEPREEFVEGVKIAPAQSGDPPITVSSPPGHSILIMLNCNSELLKTILLVLDEACILLDRYQPFPGKPILEKAAFHCLSLLHQGLIKGPKLAKLISECNSGSQLPLLMGLDKLILGINPRSGHMDHPINVGKYLSYTEWLPNHALLAIKILSRVAQTPKCQVQMLSIFSDSASEAMLVPSCVECLDAVIPEESLEESPEMLDVIGQIKEDIISMMLQCINYPAPTLSHLLLGFNIKRPLKETLLQHSGVLNCQRSCLHSILGLIDKSLPPAPKAQQNNDIPPYAQSPKLLERCFALIHTLCVSPDTARPMFRYLRACSDFLVRHLKFTQAAILTGTASSLGCASWVLRCVAVDMKLCSNDRQRSSLLHLLRPLLSIPADNELTIDMSRLRSRDQTLLTFAMREGRPTPVREFLARLLQSIDFSEQTTSNPSWHFMDHSKLLKLMQECEIKEGAFSGLIDVAHLSKRLKVLLSDNLNASSIGQRTAMSQEVKTVLSYAANVNEIRKIAAGNIRLVEAWRQVAVVLFTAAPMDVMSINDRHSLLLVLIKILLMKIEEPALNVNSHISSLASTALLLLIQSLRQCQHYYTLKSSENTSQSQPPDPIDIDVPTIKSVISGVTHWLKCAPPTAQMVRANLYGSLLIFLYTTCFDASKEEKDEAAKGLGGSFSSTYIHRLDYSPYMPSSTETTSLAQRRAAALSQLAKSGEILVSSMCTDAIKGQEVCRMLAYCALSGLVRLAPDSGWASFMCRFGYLQTMIQSLPKSDQQLRLTLRPMPSTVKPLYVYEALMSMMCRLAMTRSHAETLLRYQLLDYLSSLTALDCHPYPSLPGPGEGGELMPSVNIRYQQVLLPALLVSDAVLCSLNNQSCVEAVVHFMIRHDEALSLVLRGGSPLLPADSLNELRIVLNLLARVTADIPIQLEASTVMTHLRPLALALLPRFVLTASLVSQLRVKARTVKNEDRCMLLVIRIVILLLTLTRRLSHKSTNGAMVRPIFRPCADDTVSEFADVNLSTVSVASIALTRSPDVGLLLAILEETSAIISRVREERDSESTRLSMYDTQPLNQTRDREEQEGELMANKKKQMDRVQHRRDELQALAHLIEQALHLLWAHLDLYFRRNLPHPGHPLSESLLEPSFKPSLHDLVGLKEAVLNKFTELVERRTVEAMKDEPEKSQLFVSMLIRRIKRLVQFVPV